MAASSPRVNISAAVATASVFHFYISECIFIKSRPGHRLNVHFCSFRAVVTVVFVVVVVDVVVVAFVVFFILLLLLVDEEEQFRSVFLLRRASLIASPGQFALRLRSPAEKAPAPAA